MTAQKRNNKKQEPEDIFADVEKGRQPVAPPPTAPRGQQQAAEQSAPQPTIRPKKRNKRIPFVLVIIFVILVVLGLATIVASLFLNDEEPNTVADTNRPVTVSDTGVADQGGSPAVLPTVQAQEIDEDGDGLSDAEEAEYGTDPRSIDTDRDGLFDREEIKVYQTDPLNPDTDGDGNMDGTEVSNGYNPLGTGELLDLQAGIANNNQ